MQGSVERELSHQAPVNCAKYTQDGAYLVTGSGVSVRLFSPGGLVKEYREHGNAVLDVCLPTSKTDSNRFGSCAADRNVFLWDVVTGAVLRRFQFHSARVNTVDFNRDATLIVSGSYDSDVMLWDCRAAGRKPVQTLTDAKDSVESVVVSGTEIISGYFPLIQISRWVHSLLRYTNRLAHHRHRRGSNREHQAFQRQELHTFNNFR